MISQSTERTPGTPYEGACSNCGRTIRAAFFVDWHSVEHPAEIPVRCGCRLGDPNVVLYRVAATVMAVN